MYQAYDSRTLTYTTELEAVLLQEKGADRPTAQRVVMSEPQPRKAAVHSAAESWAWSLLRPAGLLFLLVGSIDVLSTWYPFAFGRPEWEFGTVTATLNGLPAPVIGLALLAAASVSRAETTAARILAVLMAIIALLVLAAAVLWITTVPIALQSVPSESVAAIGLRKAIFKSGMQILLYPTMLIWMALITWRRISQ